MHKKWLEILKNDEVTSVFKKADLTSKAYYLPVHFFLKKSNQFIRN